MRRVALGLALLVYAPGSGALALDCKKAATTSEKAICADPAALAADAAMSAAFQGLELSGPLSQRGPLAAAQVRWRRARDWRCADAKAALGACLARESDRRRAYLEGKPESGPGAPGRIAPWLQFERGGYGRAALSLELLKFVDADSAAARAFNAAIDRQLKGIVEPEKGEPPDRSYEYDWSMRLTYASPRLVSAHLSAFDDTGGAHPNSYTANINIDIDAGREARFEDLVDPGGAEKIFKYCFDSVRKQKKEKLAEQAPKSARELATLAQDVKQATGKLIAWSFDADKATVDYDPYAVGAYVEGSYDCEIPYATLRGLAKPGFPLP